MQRIAIGARHFQLCPDRIRAQAGHEGASRRIPAADIDIWNRERIAIFGDWQIDPGELDGLVADAASGRKRFRAGKRGGVGGGLKLHSGMADCVAVQRDGRGADCAQYHGCADRGHRTFAIDDESRDPSKQ